MLVNTMDEATLRRLAHPARYWNALPSKGDGRARVRCNLCPRDCIVREGDFGYCGVRGAVDGELVTFIYGRPSSIAVDPIEKKPLYHFHPGTDVLSLGTIGCNFRCKHCQNWTISFATIDRHSQMLQEKVLEPRELVGLARKHGAAGVSFTYNEPTIWMEYVLNSFDLVKRTTELYTCVVTNAFIREEPLRDLLHVCDAYRADLKTMRPREMTRLMSYNRPQEVLNSIALAAKLETHLEVVTNVVTNWNDSEEELEEMAQWMQDSVPDSTPWHFTRYFPSAEFSEQPTPLAKLERAAGIAKAHGFRFVYLGNVAGESSTHCPDCGALVIERTGYRTKVLAAGPRCPECGTPLPLVGIGQAAPEGELHEE